MLAGHCADVGRDYDTINKTSLCTVLVAPTMEEAEQPPQRLPPGPRHGLGHPRRRMRALVAGRLVVGDGDTAGEQLQKLLGVGLDGLTFNLPANGHLPEAVAHTVGVVKAAVG